MTLPASEREKVASSLRQSTHNSELTDIDREWISVAEERFADLQSGEDAGILESEFFAKVRKKVQGLGKTSSSSFSICGNLQNRKS